MSASTGVGETEGDKMICQFCEHTDGCEYTSIPPQIKCTITNKFHYYNDECDVEWTPVKHGRWEEEDDAIVHGHCSSCGWSAIWQKTDVFGMPYCPNCGAKMNLESKNESD